MNKLIQIEVGFSTVHVLVFDHPTVIKINVLQIFWEVQVKLADILYDINKIHVLCSLAVIHADRMSQTCHRWPPWSSAAARWTVPHWSGGWWAAACWAGSRWKTESSPAATRWSRRCGPACWARCLGKLRSCSRHQPDGLWRQRGCTYWSVECVFMSVIIVKIVLGAEIWKRNRRALTVASLLDKPEFAGRPISWQSDNIKVLCSWKTKA